MANRVPLIVDTTNLHLKELPLGDALDLTGCGIVGLTSFTPGTGGGFRFVGVTTFGMGTGIATVFVNDGLIANYLRATNLTDNRVVTAGAGGTLTDSSDLTYDGSTLAVTGAITASTNLTVTGNATVNGNVDLGNAATDSITPTGRFDAHIIPLTDDAVDLGASGVEFKDLYIDGTANIDALVADSAKISDLTDNRVVIAGSAGELEDSANLTFNGSKLTVVGDLDVSGSLNYTNVTDIYSVGIITANGGIIVSAGFVTCSATDNSTSTTTGVLQVSGGAGIAKNLNVGLEVKSEDLNITGISTLNDTKVGGGLTVTGAADLNSTLDVENTSNFQNDVTMVGAASTDLKWFKDTAVLKFKDKGTASFGDGQDLKIYHDSSHTWLKNDTGYLRFATDGSGFTFSNADNSTAIAQFVKGGKCELYHNGNLRIGADSHGAFITGIATVSSTSHIRIPVGNTSQRPGASIAVDGDIRYNNQTNSYEGYGNGAWGGLGGGTEIDNVINTASATGVGTFAKGTYRSASIRAQIDQGGSYQVGRYLLIHDGTTVTVVEEAAIATGSMLGSFDGVINGSNVEFKVTMVSAGIATVTTIIDKITI